MAHPLKKHVPVKICVKGHSNAAVWPMLSMAHQHPPRLTTKLPRYLKVLPKVDIRTYRQIEFEGMHRSLATCTTARFS